MSRFTPLALAAGAALALTAGTVGAQAAPLPAMTSAAVGGTTATVDQVRWRGGGYYGGYRGGYRGGYARGYGYRRGIGAGGALAAGAALGIIGGAIAANSAPAYGYGYGYPAYGYGGYGGYAPVSGYGYGYGYPAYGQSYGYYGY